MAGRTLRVFIPDQAPMDIPDNGQSDQEVRRSLIDAGFTQLETATLRRDGNEIRFERPQGGDKGSL